EGQTAPLDLIHGRPVAAFCGIGNPEAFRHTLAALGAAPSCFRTFADHHAYTRTDIAQLHAWARQLPSDALALTTQKDLVKIRLVELGARPLWALRIGLQVETGLEILARHLDDVLQGYVG